MNRNNILAAIAALASTVIVGCASLDDRLASTDPRVKNEAEHELIQISRATGTESDRIAAINRISNRDFLYEIAMKATTNQWVAEDASFDPSGYDGFQKSGSQGTYYSNMRTYYKTTAYGPIYKSVHGKLLDTTKEGVAAFDRLALDISKTDDYKKLFELIRKAESPYVRLAVLKSVKDPKWSQTMAKELARATSDPAIQAEAFARIEPPEARFAAMAQYAVDAKTRKDAFAKLTDQKTIDEVILKTSDKTFLLDGMAKVSDKATLASRVFSKDFIGDKDVTGKFISDYADEAMLVKIVNEHGEELSPDQCATIKAKSNNAELQNAIAKLADIKVLAEIQALKTAAIKQDADNSYKRRMEDAKDACRREWGTGADAKKELKKREKEIAKLREDEISEKRDAPLNNLTNQIKDWNALLKECLAKFSQLGNQDIRTQFLTNEIFKIADSGNNEYYAPRVVPSLSDEDIMSLNKVYKDNRNVLEIILKEAKSETLIGIILAQMSDGAKWVDVADSFFLAVTIPGLGGTRSMRSAARDWECEKLVKIFDVLPSSIDFLSADLIYKMAADKSLDETYISKFKIQAIDGDYSQKWCRLTFGGKNDSVRDFIRNVVSKLSPDAKKKLCDAARKKAEAQKGKSVVFGPFYLGMPYLDALLLQEEIWGVDKGIEIWSNYQEKGEHNISDMASVWKISFNNKAKFQFIDCKDSLVLPQFIHQFVEGKPGKVSSDFGYASDIKSEYDEKDERIYSAYSNTKRGIKVQYSAKYGILNMVEL